MDIYKAHYWNEMQYLKKEKSNGDGQNPEISTYLISQFYSNRENLIDAKYASYKYVHSALYWVCR